MMDEKRNSEITSWLLHTSDGREELRRLMSLRKENPSVVCKECGLCCKHSGCNYYDDVRKCIIWDSLVRFNFPMVCRIYPMFPEQLVIRGVKGRCRYYWDENVKVNYIN